MIIKPELLKKIRHYFNLNIYEAKVWLALLSKGISSAGEIAELSGVPRSRTYDVLESLEKQGFAIAKLGKPVKYISVNPSVVIEKLKNNAVKEAEEKNEVLSNLKETDEYEELELLHKQGIQPISVEELSGAIRGKSNIYAQLQEMANNAKEEIIIATTADALQHEVKSLKPILEKLAKRGVYAKLAINKPHDSIKELNAKVKQIDLNARFFLVDKNQLLFMLTDKNANKADEETAVWINSQFFTSAMRQLFMNAWGG